MENTIEMSQNSESTQRKQIKVKNRVTLSQVAKLVGVSTGTASRALNSVGYVSKSTREKVLRVAKELDYVPNRAGLTLKTTKTNLVMLAIPDTSNEVYFGMIESFYTTLKQNNYSTVLYYTNGQYEEEMKALYFLKERAIDGLFLVHFSYEQNMFDEIARIPAPVVLCGMCNHLWATGEVIFDTISIDVYKGIYDMVCHLIQMGHKKIGFLAGRKGIEVYRQRYEAYKAALQDYNIPYREEYVMWNDYTEIGGYNSGRKLFQMSDRPSAICATNDLQAIGCWKAVRDLGGNIPNDIVLTGLDNINITDVLSITSVNMKESCVGEEAAKLLLQRLNQKGNDDTYQNLYFRPELVIRGSSLSLKKCISVE